MDMDFVRTLAHPGLAPAPCAGAWALEGVGGAPTVAVLEDARDLPPGPPRTSTLFLWCGVPLPEGRDDALSRLSPRERLELSRYRNESDRLSIAAARAVARVQLGIVLGCRPDEVGLVRSAAGKPSPDPARHGDVASRVHFSVSHARGLVAVGVAGAATGIDVEPVRPVPDMDGLARTAFAPEVAGLVATARDDARTALFFRFWVLGEAFIKATGQGVGQGLDTFAFTPCGRPRLERVSERWGGPDRWTFGMWPETEHAATAV